MIWFWIIAGLLILAALIALLKPLLRATPESAGQGESVLVVRVLFEPRGEPVDHGANHRLPLLRRHRLSRGNVLCRRPGPLRSGRLVTWSNLSEAFLHELAPWRLGRRRGQQCAQRSLGCL